MTFGRKFVVYLIVILLYYIVDSSILIFDTFCSLDEVQKIFEQNNLPWDEENKNLVSLQLSKNFIDLIYALNGSNLRPSR